MGVGSWGLKETIVDSFLNSILRNFDFDLLFSSFNY